MSDANQAEHFYRQTAAYLKSPTPPPLSLYGELLKFSYTTGVFTDIATLPYEYDAVPAPLGDPYWDDFANVVLPAGRSYISQVPSALLILTGSLDQRLPFAPKQRLPDLLIEIERDPGALIHKMIAVNRHSYLSFFSGAFLTGYKLLTREHPFTNGYLRLGQLEGSPVARIALGRAAVVTALVYSPLPAIEAHQIFTTLINANALLSRSSTSIPELASPYKPADHAVANFETVYFPTPIPSHEVEEGELRQREVGG